MILCPICEHSKGLGHIQMEVCRKCLKMLNIEQLRYRDDYRRSRLIQAEPEVAEVLPAKVQVDKVGPRPPAHRKRKPRRHNATIGGAMKIYKEPTIEEDYRTAVRYLDVLTSRFEWNPGHSDLDNEQPESLPTTLGELRKIKMLLQRIKHKEAR